MSIFSRLFGKRPGEPVVINDPKRAAARKAFREQREREERAQNLGIVRTTTSTGSEFRSDAWREAQNRGKAKSPYTTRTDAAFDEDETANFLLGMACECRSSWIASAQWIEGTASLILTVRKSGKSYTFPNQDYGAAVDFAKSYSKGSWFWIEWRGKYGTTHPVALDEHDLPAGVSRRIL